MEQEFGAVVPQYVDWDGEGDDPGEEVEELLWNT